MYEQIDCPVLLVGGLDDNKPSPALLQRVEKGLKAHGKTVDLLLVKGGHGFAEPTLPAYEKTSAAQAWSAALAFLGLSRRLSPTLTLEHLRPDAVLVRHAFPWSANSLLVRVADDEVVFVDTPYTPDATQEVLGWLADHWGNPSVVGISTGYHVDNLGGVKTLLDAGYAVHGSSLTARLLGERGEQVRSQLLSLLTSPSDAEYARAHAAVPYVAPNRLFDAEKGLTLRFGGERVEVFYPGPSHATDNLVVYFSGRRLLFGGCMVKALEADNLGFVADADLRGWPDALERVARRYARAELVIPGHGEPGGMELLSHTRALLSKHAKHQSDRPE